MTDETTPDEATADATTPDEVVADAVPSDESVADAPVVADESVAATEPVVAEEPVAAEPVAAEPVADEATAGRANNRKVRDGLVTSNAMDKTAVVAVTDRVRHRRYSKTMQRTTKLYVHDEDNDLNVGDKVRVQETRPLSKKKRWRVLEVLERAR